MKSLKQSSPPAFRSGRTLIEMMVIIAVLSVMMMMSVSLMVLMARAERSSARELHANATVLRFSHTFREDVHRSQSVSVEDQKLVLSRSGQPAITYLNGDQGIIRRRDGEENRNAASETFRNLLLTNAATESMTDRPTLVEVRIAMPRNMTALPIAPTPHDAREIRLLARLASFATPQVAATSTRTNP